jgi:hypothetical protein
VSYSDLRDCFEQATTNGPLTLCRTENFRSCGSCVTQIL